MPQVHKTPVRSASDDDAGRAAAQAPASTLRVVCTAPRASARPPARPPALTRRETQCLAWCAEGKSYWETAIILGIAERTVSFHMEAVRAKLNAASNAQAVAVGLRAGLLEPAIAVAADSTRCGLR